MKVKNLSISEVSRLVKAIKKDISDEFRAYDADDTPGILLTIGYCPEKAEWRYQTGDNSYFGGAYLCPYWGVAGVYRRSNSREIAADIIEQIYNQLSE